MPFEREFATGESLLSLQQSEAFREFKGRVRPRAPGPAIAPAILNVPRNEWMPRRVIAVDGSTISEALDTGFPMAEATLMKVAVVSIDLSKLAVAGRMSEPACFLRHGERQHLRLRSAGREHRSA